MAAGKKRRKPVGALAESERELLRRWRSMPAEERRKAYRKAFAADPGAMLALVDWLVLNAPRPRHRELGFSVAEMRALLRHVEARVRLPDGVSLDEALAEFADERGMDPRTVRRAYDRTPELARLREGVRVVEMFRRGTAKPPAARNRKK